MIHGNGTPKRVLNNKKMIFVTDASPTTDDRCKNTQLLGEVHVHSLTGEGVT